MPETDQERLRKNERVRSNAEEEDASERKKTEKRGEAIATSSPAAMWLINAFLLASHGLGLPVHRYSLTHGNCKVVLRKRRDTIPLRTSTEAFQFCTLMHHLRKKGILTIGFLGLLEYLLTTLLENQHILLRLVFLLSFFLSFFFWRSIL